ncbi:hypothetical protein HPG69_010871, partial [Diceros bicornis minor]
AQENKSSLSEAGSSVLILKSRSSKSCEPLTCILCCWALRGSLDEILGWTEEDEPPLSKARQGVVLHLRADGVILDGRESTDDHAIVRYEWTLLQGVPSVDGKVIHVVIVRKTRVSVE